MKKTRQTLTAELRHNFRPGSAGRWWLGLLAKYTLFVLVLIIAGLVIARAAFCKAEKQFNERLEAYKAQVQAEAEAMASMPPSEQETRQREAEALARVLYGVKDNSTDDLRTLCWCVLNRVDNPRYPSTLEEVINQPEQWMRYSPENPVLESLYSIAYEELNAWHGGSHRPCSDEYVFMGWSAQEIVLRSDFNASSGTRYWRSK